MTNYCYTVLLYNGDNNSKGCNLQDVVLTIRCRTVLIREPLLKVSSNVGVFEESYKNYILKFIYL